ncbi:MAG: bactofilin family protein [Polyangiales bacterium]
MAPLTPIESGLYAACSGSLPARRCKKVTQRAHVGYIGPSLVVRGRLTGDGDMQIDGRFEGDIDIEGHLAVGRDGRVTSPVRAGSASVDGRLRGDVAVGDALAVRESGRVDGDVRASRVAIDDGGVVRGGISMDFDLPDDLASLQGEDR